MTLFFSNPRQYSHWFNLNLSAPSCVRALQAITQITYAVFFFFELSTGFHGNIVVVTQTRQRRDLHKISRRRRRVSSIHRKKKIVSIKRRKQSDVIIYASFRSHNSDEKAGGARVLLTSRVQWEWWAEGEAERAYICVCICLLWHLCACVLNYSWDGRISGSE